MVWKYAANFEEVATRNDPTYIKVTLTIFATEDIFPSVEGTSREEKYVFFLKYNRDGSIDRDNVDYQNWISAGHYAPSYLRRINGSAKPDGTENSSLRGRIDKLVELFGYERIK